MRMIESCEHLEYEFLLRRIVGYLRPETEEAIVQNENQ